MHCEGFKGTVHVSLCLDQALHAGRLDQAAINKISLGSDVYGVCLVALRYASYCVLTIASTIHASRNGRCVYSLPSCAIRVGVCFIDSKESYVYCASSYDCDHILTNTLQHMLRFPYPKVSKPFLLRLYPFTLALP